MWLEWSHAFTLGEQGGSVPLAQIDGDELKRSLAEEIGCLAKMLDPIRNFTAIFKDNRLYYVNPAGLRMLCCDQSKSDDLIGASFSSLLHSTYKEIGDIAFELLVEDEGLPIKICRDQKNAVDVELWVSPLPNLGKDIYLLEAKEITKHLRSAADLRIREQRLQAILNTVPDSILTLDHERRILTFNPAAEMEFQCKASEMIYRDIGELIPHLADADLSSFLDSDWGRAYQGNKYLFGNRSSGGTFPIELVVRRLSEGYDTRFTCIIRNIEDRVKAEEDLQRHLQNLEFNQKVLEGQASEAVYLAEELALQKQVVEESQKISHHLALHDPLTDLPNRRYFLEYLEKAIEQATTDNTSLCLLFIDLDNFKTVNDTLGHDAGDALLLNVASHLKKNTRDRDMVSRLGGDEFAVILNPKSMVEQEIYSQIAHRILADLHIPIESDGGIIQTSASIGAVIFPEDADTIKKLMKLADTTMYAAKEGGRNRVVFANKKA